MKKIPIAEHQNPTVVCEKCGITRKIPSLSLNYIGKPVRIKCKCGHVFTVVFERRRAYRKKVSLPGSFRSQGALEFEPMVVRDISLGGILFSTPHHRLQTGDVILIRFHLDDARKSLIETVAEVRHVQDQWVGCRFLDDQSDNKALGFYLMK